MPMPKTLFDDAIRSYGLLRTRQQGHSHARLITVTTDKAPYSLNDPQYSALWRLIDLPSVDQDLVKRQSVIVPCSPVSLISSRWADIHGQGRHRDDAGYPRRRRAQLQRGPGKAAALCQRNGPFQEVMKYYRNDPAKALEASRGIPTAVLRVRAITTVARNVDETQPAAAKSTIEKLHCCAGRDEAAETRAGSWSGIAMAGWSKIKDKDLATKALLKGLEDIKAQYAADGDADNPNGAPRPMWPSAVAYRNLFFQAAKILGTENRRLP